MPKREQITYWIAPTGQRAVALFYRNNDTESTEAGGSRRKGPFRVSRCRLWALRNGCGWVSVGAPGETDG